MPERQSQAWPPSPGRLSKRPFHALLVEALKHGFTGTLVMRTTRNDKPVEKKIFFLGGEPTYVTSNLVTECLGKLLLRANKITKEQNQESLKLLKTSLNKFQGDILIEIGAITPEERDLSLKWQAEIKIMDIFSWEDGSFAFSNNTPVKKRVLTLNIIDLAYRGLKQHLDPELLKERSKALMDMTVVPTKNTDINPNYIRFPKAERRLFENLFDPPKRLREIFPLSTMLPHKTFRIIWALHELGILDFEYIQKDLGAEIYDPAALSERIKKAPGQTYFEILEIHEISGRRDVEKGFERLAGLFSPQAVANRSPEVQALAAQFLELAEKARDYLIEDDRRRRYRLQTSGESRCRTFSTMQQGKGESELFLKQDYKNAIELFYSSTEIFPPNVEAKALLGLSIFMKSFPVDRKGFLKGLEIIKQAMSAGKNVPRAFICAGLAYRAMKKRAEAHNAFTMALKIKPSDGEARHLLNTLDKKLGQKL
ncbi:MAG: DUF4388 domain-containing protein [Deltaproteobacteria bacterium]|nr:DUF4388 domain-containing protein [Deltaproteobacteria bacterium]